MIISHRHKFIFIKTRKTAGTSVEIALSEHCGPEDVLTRFGPPEDEHMRLQLTGIGGQNYRLPLQRLRYSEARWAAKNRRVPRFRQHDTAELVRHYVRSNIWSEYLTFTIERNSFDKAVSRYHWHPGRTRPPMEEFFARSPVLHLSDWPAYTVNDDVIVDRVVRFEQLQDDLDEVTNLLSIPALSLPRAKGGHRPKKSHYSDALSPTSRARVELVCAKEICHFGYQWGPQNTDAAV
jgi:hypothetical protein